MDPLDYIGNAIPPGLTRDAIHIPILPAIAGHCLQRGDRVYLEDDHAYKWKEDSEKYYIGIVDPFMPGFLAAGIRFYIFITPKTVKSMNHLWTHPDLPTPTEKVYFDKVFKTISVDEAKKEIEKIANSSEITYNVLMNGAEEYIAYDNYLCLGGLLEGCSVPDIFWKYYEIVTGTKVPNSKKGNFFSCSC